MAKYKTYAEYKDSGYLHLGEIPKDWKILKLKHLTRCLDGQRIPLNAIERGEKKGNIPYWGANKIVDHVNDWIFDEELILLGEDGAPFFDPNKDVAFLVNGKIWPNNHVHVLRPYKKLVNPKFLTYSINCTDFSLYISGSTRDKLNQSDMDNICIRYCSEVEQTQIANFLDHETTKIDNLIEKQQQLIELLKEKRQAVISHAVTKGLDPNVPMKDSGVEWLGEVPEHWEIYKLKHACSEIFLGLTSKVDYVDSNGVPLVRALNIKDGILDLSTAKEISNEQHKQLTKYRRAKRNDVLLSKSGTIGTAAIVDTDIEFSIYESIFSLRAIENILLSEYLLFFIRSSVAQAQYSRDSVGMGVAHLNMPDIQEVRIPVPLISEQKRILHFIREQLGIYDNLILKAQISIKYMQERRTALISAAVTGKIDVRNWQVPTLAEADMEFSA